MTTFPGTSQSAIQTVGSPLSAETIAQQQFPHHTFVIVDQTHWTVVKQHTLILNPQDLNQQEPVRAQVVQTVGGAYVDDFGRGLPTVTISGNTGWRLKASPDGAGLLDGWQAFKALRNDIFRYFTDAKDTVRTWLRNTNYDLRWYNWGDDEYYSIQPSSFQLQRSASNPLYYQYNFQYTCLADLREDIARNNNRTSIWKGLDSSGSPLPTSQSVSVDISNLGALAQAMSS